MFERHDLEKLAAFTGSGTVVSLYLNMAPSLRGRGTPDAYRARLKNLLKEAAGRAPVADRAAIEEYFENEFDWTGRSVAVFSGQEDGLWQVERFAAPLRSTISVGSKPFILPLVNLMDTYGSYAVALVDQQAVRMFHLHLGEVVASEKIEGEEIKRLKSGGGAAGRARGDDLSGYSTETVRGNLKDFAEALVGFCKRHRAERVLLGGAEKTLHEFRRLLPNPWPDRIEGMFAIPMRASDGEVLQRSLQIMQAKEEARTAGLVEQIRTLAGKGANGCLGVKDTQAAIDQGRVQTLVVVEGMLPPDLADQAIAKVVDYGGTITFAEADSALAAAGGIGALLRY